MYENPFILYWEIFKEKKNTINSIIYLYHFPHKLFPNILFLNAVK